MNLSHALALAVSLSLLSSLVVIIVMLAPIRAAAAERCRTADIGAFWARFTVLMLLIVPLLFVLLFASPPPAGASDGMTELIWRTLAAALSGHVLVLGIVAFNLARPGAVLRGGTPASRNDYEFWGDRDAGRPAP